MQLFQLASRPVEALGVMYSSKLYLKTVSSVPTVTDYLYHIGINVISISLMYPTPMYFRISRRQPPTPLLRRLILPRKSCVPIP